jgi:hypothetical protein
LKKENKMRKTLIAQRSLFDQSIDTLVALFKPDAKLQKMDHIMEANPQILELVHNDLTRGLSKAGAWGMSAEQVVRPLFVSGSSTPTASWPTVSKTVCACDGLRAFTVSRFRILPACRK